MESLINKQSNKLTVIREIDYGVGLKALKRYELLCKCECGKLKKINRYAFGKVTSCGCDMKSKLTNRAVDLTNKKFGKLTVINLIENYSKKGRHWNCICECKNTKIVKSGDLVNNNTKSCGCLKKERLKETALGNRTFKTSSLNRQYFTHKGNAIQRKLTPLDKETWLKIVFKPCYYCGSIDNRAGIRSHKKGVKHESLPYTEEEFNRFRVDINGVDRIDSKQDYTFENIIPCCGWCNTMKREHTQKEFIEKISKIYNHLVPLQRDLKE
jgi:hypothetical protein